MVNAAHDENDQLCDLSSGGALRSLDVTSAAAKLHLPQSAVSMQIKRMEIILDQSLMERVGRKVALSRDGEQLSYARRMIAMNDEVWGRLTAAV